MFVILEDNKKTLHTGKLPAEPEEESNSCPEDCTYNDCDINWLLEILPKIETYKMKVINFRPKNKKEISRNEN